MSKFTFVVEYEDGKEPAVGTGTEILGGRLCSAAFFDYRTEHFTEEEANQVRDAIEEADWHGQIDEDAASSLINKLELLTQ